MIRQLITDLVLEATGLEMIHGDEGYNNLSADEAGDEVVYLIDPVKFNLVDLTFLREQYPVIMLFLKKSKLDDTPAQLDSLTQIPRLKVRSFIATCRDSGRVDISNVNAVEVLHLFDADYSGWMFYASITPKNAGSPC